MFGMLSTLAGTALASVQSPVFDDENKGVFGADLGRPVVL
jgi:hypothetical protein